MISEQSKQIIDMRLSGKGYKQIQKELGISRNCVSKVCCRYGVSYKDFGETQEQQLRKNVLEKVTSKSIFENKVDAISGKWLRRAIA